MKEDFLHYLWQYQKFANTNLRTTQGESLQVLYIGQYLQQAGPDFFNAQIVIGNQKWAGNVEIHINSSDWYLHHHERDENYDNVILHVVWQDDTEVFRKDNTVIPVLELQHYVSHELLHQYKNLIRSKKWINCENEIQSMPQLVVKNWMERLFFDRLERKSKSIQEVLKNNQNDWEATFFTLIAKNFGLNSNGEAFLELAKSIPFSVIRKEAFDVQYLEALFFGQANLLPKEPQDHYIKELVDLYQYLKIKYQIEEQSSLSVHFFRLRPDNFPTIRLAQLAMLFHKQRNLFSQILQANELEEFYKIFNVSVSEYWLSHYNLEKPSLCKEKPLSKSFIDLLIINTIVPLKFAYYSSLGEETTESYIRLLEKIISEKNAVVDKFKHIGVVAQNAFESQALLQLKNDYCDQNKCLQCAIGVAVLKN